MHRSWMLGRAVPASQAWCISTSLCADSEMARANSNDCRTCSSKALTRGCAGAGAARAPGRADGCARAARCVLNSGAVSGRCMAGSRRSSSFRCACAAAAACCCSRCACICHGAQDHGASVVTLPAVCTGHKRTAFEWLHSQFFHTCSRNCKEGNQAAAPLYLESA